ncbi:MAG: hypothetical protein II875_09540 [Clostridia bacterium]|nr:hypothetical protein [Clostridia bacterium]
MAYRYISVLNRNQACLCARLFSTLAKMAKEAKDDTIIIDPTDLRDVIRITADAIANSKRGFIEVCSKVVGDLLQGGIICDKELWLTEYEANAYVACIGGIATLVNIHNDEYHFTEGITDLMDTLKTSVEELNDLYKTAVEIWHNKRRL